jgi:sulfite exporter TauE/SafE
VDHAAHLHQVVEFSYALAFMTGLFGAGHCLGMCGGLVSAFFMKIGAGKPTALQGGRAKNALLAVADGRTAPPVAFLAYHGARVGIYAVVGLVAAVLGAVLVSTGRLGLAQGILQIVAGAVVILLGFDLLGLAPIRNAWGFAPLAWLRKQFMGATRKGPVVGAAIGGAINGLMPCSMTMAMAVQATTAPSPPEGMLLMLAFGAGTLPAMLSASVLFGKLGPRLRGWLLKGAALFVIALGISTLWQGLRYFLVMRQLVG